MLFESSTVTAGTTSSSSVTLCKRCLKVVSGVKCNKCNNVFHPSCAKLSSYVKEREDGAVICCDSNSDIDSRNKPKRQVIVGSKSTNDKKNKLQGVPKTVSLHVYRLSPDTEPNGLVDFLKPTFSVLSCTKYCHLSVLICMPPLRWIFMKNAWM
ncbi:hypothetical protein ANN_19249 [Periplaneta americana]|uniref:Phorbol-ester/DAG-type domain-containing protein n=1 Tax=Periplaneta americana TaxID=6978 RepID=A0ABQ8S9B8_PERAM|nr:hypothetical protein ANN_19249 [Periplaneta americana]